jgi:hypothetical protein
MKRRVPKRVITINATTDHHHKFARCTLAGALFKKVMAIRQGEGAIISEALNRHYEPVGFFELANAAKAIHKNTHIRLQIRPDPYRIAAALVRRFPNAPKSDVASDTEDTL